MSMRDVRDYLLKQLAELADSDAEPEQMAQNIERAKATSMVANTYIGAVKVELDAFRIYDETNLLCSAVEAPPAKQLPGGRA